MEELTTQESAGVRCAVDLEMSSPEAAALSDFENNHTAMAAARILWSQRRTLGWFAFVGLVLAVLIAFLVPLRYESVVQVVPPDSASASAGLAILASVSGGGGGPLGGVSEMLGMKTPAALTTGVLRSGRVRDRIIDRFDLRRVYGVKYYRYAREELAARTTINDDKRSTIITIKVWDHDRARAQQIAQAYVEEVNRVMSDLSTSTAHRERVFIEERLKTVKQDLDSAQTDFSQFASKNAAMNIPEQGKAMLGAVATLQGELIAAKSQAKATEAIYTSSNVRVRAAHARIAELQSELAKLGGDEHSTVESLYPSMRKLPVLGVQYADLYRRTRIQEAIYEYLSKQYEISKVQEAKDVPTVSVLDPASWPENKSFPPRGIVILAGTLFAVVSGMLWLLGRAIWDRMDPSDPTKQLLNEIASGLRRSGPGRISGAHAAVPYATAVADPRLSPDHMGRSD